MEIEEWSVKIFNKALKKYRKRSCEKCEKEKNVFRSARVRSDYIILF